MLPAVLLQQYLIKLYPIATSYPYLHWINIYIHTIYICRLLQSHQQPVNIMGKKSKKPKAPKVAPPATKEKVWIPLSDTTTVNSLHVLGTMCKHGLDTSE